jgi:sugar/nucleoside kinase (ribokinase family)
VGFVGKSGNDFFGRLFHADLDKNWITNRIFVDRYSPTGVVISFVNNQGERSLLVFRGANDKLSHADIEKASGLVKSAEYVYFSGYSLVNDPQKSAILQGIEIAKKSRTKIVFDPGAHNLVESEPRLFEKILDSCDVFSPNLMEAKAITNSTGIDEVIDRLRNKAPFTALKCGRKGSILITDKDVVKVPGFKVKCLDTTGAGDAFTAGIVFGLVRKLPLKTMGQLANWFAAQVVTQIGPRSFPTKPEISNFLERTTGSHLASF